MDILIKTCGLLLTAACSALLIRRSNPEISLLVSIAAVCAALSAAVLLLKPLGELRQIARTMYGAGDAYILPVLKCGAAAIVSKLCADICREASQNAAASAIELVGTLCALGAAMPLLRSMLDTIGELL